MKMGVSRLVNLKDEVKKREGKKEKGRGGRVMNTKKQHSLQRTPLTITGPSWMLIKRHGTKKGTKS